jgi:hypothetical protein
MKGSKILNQERYNERMARLFDLQEKALSIKPREGIVPFKRRIHKPNLKTFTPERKQNEKTE